MKRIVILIVFTLSFMSCSSFKNRNISNITKARTLLLNCNATTPKNDISKLFNLLDINKDQTIGTTEAIGVIEQNFNNLDVNNNASLSLTEFSGFLSYLQ